VVGRLGAAPSGRQVDRVTACCVPPNRLRQGVDSALPEDRADIGHAQIRRNAIRRWVGLHRGERIRALTPGCLLPTARCAVR
jgi:hypothetical protein